MVSIDSDYPNTFMHYALLYKLYFTIYDHFIQHRYENKFSLSDQFLQKIESYHI